VLINLAIASPIQIGGLNQNVAGVIEKATAKPRFNLPPTKYTYDELQQQLLSAQTLRYQSADAFLEDIKKLASQKLVSRRWWKFWEY